MGRLEALTEAVESNLYQSSKDSARFYLPIQQAYESYLSLIPEEDTAQRPSARDFKSALIALGYAANEGRIAFRRIPSVQREGFPPTSVKCFVVIRPNT